MVARILRCGPDRHGTPLAAPCHAPTVARRGLRDGPVVIVGIVEGFFDLFLGVAPPYPHDGSVAPLFAFVNRLLLRRVHLEIDAVGK